MKRKVFVWGKPPLYRYLFEAVAEVFTVTAAVLVWHLLEK
jgi:hypothetical protein